MKLLMVLGGDEPGEDREPAVLDREVVVSAAERDAAHLGDAKPSPLGPVVERQLLEKYDAVGDGMQLQIVHMRGQVVEQQDGALAAGKEVLEGQDLTAIAQGVLRQQAHFRQAVEHHAYRPVLANLLEDHLGGFGELDLGGME